MTGSEQREAARQFINRWRGKRTKMVGLIG